MDIPQLGRGPQTLPPTFPGDTMPMPTNPYGSSPMQGAVADLGFAAQDLIGQVAGETEEQRRRRLQELQQQRLFGSAASPANLALFGGSLSAIR